MELDEKLQYSLNEIKTTIDDNDKALWANEARSKSKKSNYGKRNVIYSHYS